jgi:hypothetical protein
MFSRAKLLGATLAVAVLLASAGPARAQFRAGGMYSVGYRTPATAGFNPYFGYGGSGGWGPYAWGGDPYGGYLSGAANVINAQGQYMINTQQAYLTKQQVKSAMIDNRRKAFDEWLYEKQNTPTLNDVRIQSQRDELTRALTQPPETEIWSAKSLNDIFNALKDMQAKGATGPDVPLNSATLRQINVTVKGVGNQGLVKENAKIQWPVGLRSLPPQAQTREMRDQIDTLMSQCKRQAASGQEVDAGALQEISRTIERLRQMLKGQIDNLSFGDYTAARRFLGELDGGVTVLKQPTAANFVNGTYAAKGHNVQELVQYMTQNGLSFAPACAGEEGSYNALYQSLLQYFMGANSMLAHSQGSSSSGSPKQ